MRSITFLSCIVFLFALGPLTAQVTQREETADTSKTRLLESRPNPFTETTQIRFYLAEADQVDLAVYDLNGRLVKRILWQYLPAGDYTYPFQANKLAQGTYLVHLKVGNQKLQVQKIEVIGRKSS